MKNSQKHFEFERTKYASSPLFRNTDVLNSNSAAPSLNIQELKAFRSQLERLPCIIDQAELVQVNVF